jgi:hypothetical protein
MTLPKSCLKCGLDRISVMRRATLQATRPLPIRLQKSEMATVRLIKNNNLLMIGAHWLPAQQGDYAKKNGRIK